MRRPSPSSPSQPVGGDAYVVEAHRGGRRAGEAHLALRRVGGQALGVGRHEEAGDAVAVVGGAGHHLVEVGVAAVGGPGLRAVDDVGVAVAARRRTHRGGVGAGVRLGEAVGAEQLAAEHVGQPLSPSAPRCRTRRGRSTTGRARRRRRRPRTTRRRSPRAPGGRPRRAGRRRRPPRGRAGTSRPAWPSMRKTSRGKVSVASASAERGASSLVASSRVRASRSRASSVGSWRRAVMRRRLPPGPARPKSAAGQGSISNWSLTPEVSGWNLQLPRIPGERDQRGAARDRARPGRRGDHALLGEDGEGVGDEGGRVGVLAPQRPGLRRRARRGRGGVSRASQSRHAEAGEHVDAVVDHQHQLVVVLHGVVPRRTAPGAGRRRGEGGGRGGGRAGAGGLRRRRRGAGPGRRASRRARGSAGPTRRRTRRWSRRGAGSGAPAGRARSSAAPSRRSRGRARAAPGPESSSPRCSSTMRCSRADAGGRSRPEVVGRDRLLAVGGVAVGDHRQRLGVGVHGERLVERRGLVGEVAQARGEQADRGGLARPGGADDRERPPVARRRPRRRGG